MSNKTTKTRADIDPESFNNLVNLLSFNNLVNLLGVYSQATNSLAELEAEVNNNLLALVDDKKSEYAELQKALTDSEKAIGEICLAHPEWFTVKRSIKTPYGEVAFRRSEKLEVPNEEATILLIKAYAERHADFDGATLVRTQEVLDREALEKLDDATLKAFRVRRVPSENLSVKAAKVSLGKAVKEAAESEAA